MAIEIIQVDNDGIFFRLKRTRFSKKWRVTQGDGSVWVADFAGRDDALAFMAVKTGPQRIVIADQELVGRTTSWPRK